jgi:hypothetical protein
VGRRPQGDDESRGEVSRAGACWWSMTHRQRARPFLSVRCVGLQAEYAINGIVALSIAQRC